MKRIILQGALVSSLVLSLLTAGGCAKRRLFYPWELSARVRVKVDWSQCLEKPSGMTLCLYGDNGMDYKTVTSDVDEVEVDVMSGTYTAMVFCYSREEWQSLRLSGTDSYGAERASLPLSVSTWRATDGLADMVSSQAPSVISSVGDAAGFTVTDDEVDAWQEHVRLSGKQRWEEIEGGVLDVLTLRPRDLVYGLEVRFRVNEVQNLKAVRAGIDGMAAWVGLADGRTGDETVVQTLDDVWTLRYDAQDESKATVTGKSRTLGLPGDATRTLPDALRDPSKNTLDLHILLRDLVTVIDTTIAVGGRWAVEPSHNRQSEPKTKMTLVLKVGFGEYGDDDLPFTLPEVQPIEGNSSGFDAVVGEWEQGETVEMPL